MHCRAPHMHGPPCSAPPGSQRQGGLVASSGLLWRCPPCTVKPCVGPEKALPGRVQTSSPQPIPSAPPCEVHDHTFLASVSYSSSPKSPSQHWGTLDPSITARVQVALP